MFASALWNSYLPINGRDRLSGYSIATRSASPLSPRKTYFFVLGGPFPHCGIDFWQMMNLLNKRKAGTRRTALNSRSIACTGMYQLNQREQTMKTRRIFLFSNQNDNIA